MLEKMFVENKMYRSIHSTVPLSSSLRDINFSSGKIKVNCTDDFISLTMGPFETKGGTDHTRIEFMYDLSRTCLGENMSVNLMESLLIDSKGRKIPYPPLHIHHSHLFSPQGDYLLDYYDNTAEYHCIDQFCKISDLSPYTMKLPGVIISYSLINDIRPQNSTRLTWFLQYYFRLTGNDNHVSRLACYNKFSNKYAKENSGLTVIPVPTDVETFSAYKFRFKYDGWLVPRLTRFHSHQLFSLESYLFKNINFTFTNCLPIVTQETLFQSNHNLTSYLRDQLPLCRSSLTLTLMGDKMIDSVPDMNCRSDYIRTEDVLTSVTIWGKRFKYTVPKHVNQHHAWILFFKENASTPHYNMTYPEDDGTTCERDM